MRHRVGLESEGFPGPGTKGTCVEECNKCEGQGRTRRRRQKEGKTERKQYAKKRTQHAKNILEGKQNAKQTQTKSNNNAKQNANTTQRKCKNDAQHIVFLLLFRFSRFNSESTPESALRPRILVALLLHFVCVLFCLPFASFVVVRPGPSHFFSLLHARASPQTPDQLYDPRTATSWKEFRMCLGRTPQVNKTARPKARANMTR